MAGPEAVETAAAAAAAGPQQQKQPQFGAIGDASQVVEAALQARVAASQEQQFATTKTLFFAVSSLCGALRLELRLRNLGQVCSCSVALVSLPLSIRLSLFLCGGVFSFCISI